MRVAGRQRGLLQPFGMRSEHHGPGLRRAVGIGDQRLGEHRLRLVDQRLGERRRAHAHHAHRGEVGRGQKLLLAQHHGDHGRHGGEEVDFVLGRRLDVALGGELRQQHDRVALAEDRLAGSQPVHVIERRRHQRALAGRAGPAGAYRHRPGVREVRQHHALGPAGRARGVEEQRRLVGLHLGRRERALIQERREVLVERDLRDRVGRQRQPRVVADRELGVAVLDDVGDGLGRQLEIHRHRDEAGLHGAEEGQQILGAIGRQDRHAIAALQAALQEPARDGAGQAAQVGVGVLALAACSQVEQRDPIAWRLARDCVALVVEFHLHRAYPSPNLSPKGERNMSMSDHRSGHSPLPLGERTVRGFRTTQ